MANLQVRGIEDRLYEALRARAELDNRSISQEVVTIIEQFLARPAETHQPRDGLEGSKCLQRRQGGGGAHFASCFRLRVISLSGFPDISQIDQ